MMLHTLVERSAEVSTGSVKAGAGKPLQLVVGDLRQVDADQRSQLAAEVQSEPCERLRRLVCVRLEESTYEELEVRAKMTNTNISECIRYHLGKGLETDAREYLLDRQPT